MKYRLYRVNILGAESTVPTKCEMGWHDNLFHGEWVSDYFYVRNRVFAIVPAGDRVEFDLYFTKED